MLKTSLIFILKKLSSDPNDEQTRQPLYVHRQEWFGIPTP